MLTNGKSMALGAAIGILIGATLGVVITRSMVTTTKHGSSFGRYQLVQSSPYILKIDTVTGQVWKTPAFHPAEDFMAEGFKN